MNSYTMLFIIYIVGAFCERPNGRTQFAPTYKLFIAFIGAGDGNRTHTRSLGSFSSATKLRPRKIY